jgi:phosphoribosylformimino-5-aminoimidazole carboxamide ribotide isomerase
MLIIPAVDLLGGKAVRLYQGSYDKVSTYDQDPVSAAKRLADAGITRLHVVDLDAARNVSGEPDRHNRRTIEAIRRAVDCEVEVGGGIRTARDVAELDAAGVDWFIVGTALVKDPQSVASWIVARPGRFIAGIDAFDGKVKIAGWEGDAGLDDASVARQARELGFSAVIYTNISRDGTLAGPDLARTKAVAKAGGLPVIVSGGVSGDADIEAVYADADPLILGVITGKALYEGRIDLEALCRRHPQSPAAKETRK